MYKLFEVVIQKSWSQFRSEVVAESLESAEKIAYEYYTPIDGSGISLLGSSLINESATLDELRFKDQVVRSKVEMLEESKVLG